MYPILDPFWKFVRISLGDFCVFTTVRSSEMLLLSRKFESLTRLLQQTVSSLLQSLERVSIFPPFSTITKATPYKSRKRSEEYLENGKQ